MDTQQMFNTVYLGLKSQGFKRSVDEEESVTACRYRGSHGLKCAAGWLIPDKKYKETIEGYAVIDHPVTLLFLNMGYTDHQIDLIRRMQYIHDNSTFPQVMQSKLHDFAVHHSLTIPQEPTDV